MGRDAGDGGCAAGDADANVDEVDGVDRFSLYDFGEHARGIVAAVDEAGGDFDGSGGT